MAGQQAAQYKLSGAQQLADMAAQQSAMQAEGYATQAAAAGKMLEIGNIEEQRQNRMIEVGNAITQIIDSHTKWWGDDVPGMARAFDDLIARFQNDPYIVAYLRQQKDKAIGTYQGIDKQYEAAPFETYLQGDY